MLRNLRTGAVWYHRIRLTPVAFLFGRVAGTSDTASGLPVCIYQCAFAGVYNAEPIRRNRISFG